MWFRMWICYMLSFIDFNLKKWLSNINNEKIGDGICLFIRIGCYNELDFFFEIKKYMNII